MKVQPAARSCSLFTDDIPLSLAEPDVLLEPQGPLATLWILCAASAGAATHCTNAL